MKNSDTRARYLSGAAAFVLLAASGYGASVSAQSADDDQPVTEEKLELDEIEITTQFQNSLVNRLPIGIEELPFSLDIIDRSFIEERGFIRPLEALTTIPNVVIQSDEFASGAPNFLVRGFAASILVNNRPETGSRGFGRRDDVFVERYEVLKGPASISLGPVLPGGIINTVTKSPQADPFANVELRAGRFGQYRAELDLNSGNLFNSEIFRTRLSIGYENSDFVNPIENREIFAIRPVIEIDLTPATRSQFSFAYRENDTVPSLPFAIFQDGTIPEAFDNDIFFGPQDGVGAQGKDILADGEIQHDFLDSLKLTLRGSYQDTDLDYQNTQGLYNYNFDEGQFGIAPSNPVGLFYASTGTFDEQVAYFDSQLAWTENPFIFGKLDIVAGGTFQRTEGLSTFGIEINPDFPANGFSNSFVNGEVNVLDPDFFALPVPVNTVEPTPFFVFEDTLWSVYSEVVWRPFDWLTIPAGVRYDNLENRIIDPTAGGDDLAEDDDVQDTVDDTDDVTFRIGATAEATEWANVYVSFAESFVPQSGVVRGGDPVGPETARSVEIGTKMTFFDGRLGVTGAAFNTIRDNVANGDPTNSPAENFVVGAGEQRHRGFELGINGEILPGWDANISYGYLDAEFTEDLDGNEGLRATQAPEHTFSAFSSYTFQSGTLDTLQLGGGVRFLSDRPGAVGTDLEFDGYTLLDVFASYQLRDNVRVQVNVNNITDELYLEETGNSGRPSGGFQFGDPRSFQFTIYATF